MKLEEKVIIEAKLYAKAHKTSISAIVENYLKSISSPTIKKQKITPLVKSLSGIIKADKVDNYKKDYADFLSAKYK